MLPWRWRRTSWSHQKESSIRYTSNDMTTSGTERTRESVFQQSSHSCWKPTLIPWMKDESTTHSFFSPDNTDNSTVLKLWLRILNQWVNKSQQLSTHAQSSKFLSLAANQSSHSVYGAHSASAINSRAAQLTHTAHTRGETESERWNKVVLGGKFTQ